MPYYSTPVYVTLITYSYSHASFHKPDQAKIYTSFTFNTEKSIKRILSYWITIGAGNYEAIDILFSGSTGEPHWSGLSQEGVLKLEIDLRQRKLEAVVQIIETLESLWRIGVFPPDNDALWLASAAYEVWNGLTDEIWNLHLLKYQQASSSPCSTSIASFQSTLSRYDKTPSHKDLEGFDDASDNCSNYSWVIEMLDGSSTLPNTKPREDSFAMPDLSSLSAVNTALDYWTERNRNHTFYDLEYLSYLCSEEFDTDRGSGYSYVQGFGVRKSVTAWEIILGLRQVLYDGIFPPRDKAASMVHKSFKKWNQCSREVQVKINEELANLGPSAPLQMSFSRLYTEGRRKSTGMEASLRSSAKRG